MKLIERLKTDKKFLIRTILFVLASFVIPYITIPILVFLWLSKKLKLSKAAKIIVSGVTLGLLILLLALTAKAYKNDIDPHLSIQEPTENTTTNSDKINIKGSYDPKDRKVWVNGININASNGEFTYTFPLKVGENKIKVEAGNWKRDSRELRVIRTQIINTPSITITPTVTSGNTDLPKQIKEVVKEVENKPDSNKVIEDKVRASLKKQTNTNKVKIRELLVTPAYDNEKEYVVFVAINSDDNLNNNYIRDGLFIDNSEIYISLFKESLGVREANIVSYFPTVDKYGQESDSVVLKTNLTSVEASKVNWKQDGSTLKLGILPNVWKTTKSMF
jgi:hypothetical protein